MLNKLKFGIKNSSGRNLLGKITAWHRGSGVKNKFRLVDFKPTIKLTKQVISIDYDPNRSSFIALIAYSNGYLSYILAPSLLNVGDIIEVSDNNNGKRGGFISEFIKLKYIKEGSFIYGIESRPGSGATYIRSAGCFGMIMGERFQNYILVKLPSGELRLFSKDCKAFIGAVSNPHYSFKVLKKAGVNRNLNKRPIVRGVAMNPVDHPHGGGEGKSSGGRPSVSPWGKLTKSRIKTRNKKKYSFKI